MKVPVSMLDKQKSYYKYYVQDLAPMPKEKLEAIREIPGDSKEAMNIGMICS